MDIKTYLRLYLPTLRYAMACFRELDTAREVGVKSPKLDGMPRAGSGGGLENQVARIDALQRKAEAARDKCLDMLEEIEGLIENLPEMEQRMVLKLRYIYGEPWERVAMEAHMSQSTAIRVHGAALNELRKTWRNEGGESE